MAAPYSATLCTTDLFTSHFLIFVYEGLTTQVPQPAPIYYPLHTFLNTCFAVDIFRC